MGLILNCPGCKAEVPTRTSDAGKNIRCGICWTEVQVPQAEGTAEVPVEPTIKHAKLLSAPATPVVAKALPTTPPVAKAVPAAPIPAAKILPALPVTPTPTRATKLEDEDRPFPKRSSKRNRNDDDNDDDDDDVDDRKTKGRSAPTGMLIVVSLVGLLVVGGLTAAVIYLVGGDSDTSKSTTPSSSRDGYIAPKPVWEVNNNNPLPNNNGFNNPPGQGFQPEPFQPGGGFQPPQPRVDPWKEPDWKPVEKADGFSADVPGVMTAPVPSTRTLWRSNNREELRGMRHNSLTVIIPQKVFMGFEIEYLDVPQGSTVELDVVCKEIYFMLSNTASVKSSFGGQDGIELKDNRNNIVQYIVKAARVGPRIYIAKVQINSPQQHPKSEEYAKKFFDSFKITYDANTPAPPPARNNNPFPVRPSPFPPNNAPGIPIPASPNPALPNPVGIQGTTPAVFARVQPFWCSAVIPEKNELITLGPKVPGTFGRGGGVLRRYSLPDFKLKASYSMPRAATKVIYDAKSNQLLTTTANATKLDNTIRDSERTVAFGDIEYYDLGPILKGTLKETDELKPAATIAFTNSKLTGLEISPDRNFLYTVKTTQVTQAGRRFWKAKLVRVDFFGRKVKDELDLLNPVHAVKLSPDGKTLYMAEIQISDFGSEILGAGAGKIACIDTSAWRLDRAVILPGAPFDFELSPDGTRILAACAGRAGPILVTVPTNGGDTLELNPNDIGRAGGYCALSPDGKKMVTSTRQGEGIDVYDVKNIVTKDGLILKARGKETGGDGAKTALGGHFQVTPDGRFAVFQIGVVIDLNNPTTKPME